MDNNTVPHKPVMLRDMNAVLQITICFTVCCACLCCVYCHLRFNIFISYFSFGDWKLILYFILLLVIIVIVVCVLKDEFLVRLLVCAVCWCADRILSMENKECVFGSNCTKTIMYISLQGPPGMLGPQATVCIDCRMGWHCLP